MFAICSKYSKIKELKEIPSGKYLCIDCTEETREESLNRLIQTAKDKYHTTPNFSIQLIVITGILKWNYQLQVLIEQDI